MLLLIIHPVLTLGKVLQLELALVVLGDGLGVVKEDERGQRHDAELRVYRVEVAGVDGEHLHVGEEAREAVEVRSGPRGKRAPRRVEEGERALRRRRPVGDVGIQLQR